MLNFMITQPAPRNIHRGRTPRWMQIQTWLKHQSLIHGEIFTVGFFLTWQMDNEMCILGGRVMGKFYSKHLQLMQKSCAHQVLKKARNELKPRRVEIRLARTFLQTVFHWKMPDHKEWSDLWKSITPDRVTVRSIPCQLSSSCSSLLQEQIQDVHPHRHLHTHPMSSAALEATRSSRATEIQCHCDLSAKLHDRHPGVTHAGVFGYFHLL